MVHWLESHQPLPFCGSFISLVEEKYYVVEANEIDSIVFSHLEMYKEI
jgi:hypothetical protein